MQGGSLWKFLSHPVWYDPLYLYAARLITVVQLFLEKCTERYFKVGDDN